MEVTIPCRFAIVAAENVTRSEFRITAYVDIIVVNTCPLKIMSMFVENGFEGGSVVTLIAKIQTAWLTEYH